MAKDSSFLEPKTSKTASKKKSFLQKELSPVIFASSMMALLILGLSFFIGLRLFINSGYVKTLWEENQPVTKLRNEFNLSVSSPDDNILVFDKSLLVSGESSAKATIIISTDTDDYPFQAADNGSFSKSIPLTKGINRITISAFDTSGASKRLEKTVYFSPEQL